MEQLVLLLIIGAISLINWLIEQSGKRREKRRLEKQLESQESEVSPYRQPTTPVPASATDSAQRSEMRRFLQSFGIPLPDPSDEVVAERDLPAPIQMPAPLVPAPVVEAKTPSVFVKTVPIALGLKSPAALRQAIVWREILGPPRSL